MRCDLVAVLLLASPLSAAPVFAQDTAVSGVGARVLPGVAFQHGVFGDDKPRGHSEIGLTLGGQLCMNRSEDHALIVEATVPFNSLDNPYGGEWVRAVPVLVGYQAGRDSYMRASIGIAVQFWKYGGSRRGIEVSVAGSIAVGRNFGADRQVATEGVLQIAGSPGFVSVSIGGQVPIGRCYGS